MSKRPCSVPDMEHNGFVSWSVVIARSMYQMPLNFCPSIIHFLELMVTPRVQITVPICPINCCELLRRTFYFWGELPVEGHSFLSGSNWKCSWRHVLIQSWWGLEMGDYFLALCFDGACHDVVLFFACYYCWFHRIVMRKMIRYPLVLGQDQCRGVANSRWKPRSGRRRRDGKEEETVFIETILSPNWETKSVISANASLRVVAFVISLCPCVFRFMSDRPLTDFQPSLDIMLSNHCPPTRRMQETIIIIYLFPPVSSSTVVLQQDDPLPTMWRDDMCSMAVEWHIIIYPSPSDSGTFD